MRRLLKRLMAAGDKYTTPRSALTLSTVVVFVLFLILLSVAVRFAIKSLWVALIIIGTCASLFLLIATFLEYHWRGNREYVSGRGYTILVISLAIPAFTGLYSKSWYTQLRNNVLVTSTDSVASVRFPSIAILQREDWTSQGTLLTGGSKCYLGWYNDNAPNCASLDPSTLGNSTMCTCKEFWYNSDEVIENFTWMNTKYRYKVFDPPSWFIDNNPTYLLLLQTFFNYNATKARDESSTTNPSLLLAVYDPTLGMQKSFDLGYTRMNLVNANGILAVNIGLHVRDDGNGITAYDYQLSLVSSPAIDLVCDMSSPGDYKYPCHLTLFIQIPNFQRTITVTKSAMTWVDAASAAGGFLSFLQFLSWIISAQAWLGH